MTDIIEKIDELIGKPRYLIDIFPGTVPQTDDRRYFEIEEIFQQNRKELNEKFCRIILKLYCYYDFWVSAGDGSVKNPRPEQLVQWVYRCFAGDWRERDYINIILPACDAMVVLNGDDLYMILCNPDRQLMELVPRLAGAEGLFFYKAPESPA